ncbi:unnamed protein product [Caenorhabditis bovis]|uniref:Uncharacterized protein n=1 Tax=Caenorhabditis bovis TaxID=2654633 RepID=A0A8S1FC36_9PELO|nr:unnamed protein product [Caenorhabditis bovis]
MSQLNAINFTHLEEFLSREGSSEEEIREWYEKLSEYEIEGNETPQEIELLYNGARYIMSFAFTAAEELRDVAEQEAVQVADKEEQWEEERNQLKEELESLRERITSKAEIGDSTETFRAQIDSLKQENRQLQQTNRDRDREMADQRDRFENLAARVETVTRERDALQEHKIHLEDTIRELNRRLSSKTEDTGGDWESKKLRMRNEQVLTMSRQMQAVITQNEELREEIDRVSDALEEATRIIDQSAVRYSDIASQLEASNQRVGELVEQNRIITEGLPDKLIENLPKCMAAAEKLVSGLPKDKINFLYRLSELVLPHFLKEEDQKALEDETGYTKMVELQEQLDRSQEKVKSLQEELANVVEEANRLQMLIREDRTGEKEQELEQLKKELMAATTLARNLFGEAMSETPGQDPSVSLQMRIFQLENNVKQLNEQLEEREKILQEFQFTIEQKDIANSEVLAELNRLREEAYGSSWEEIARLEKQLRIRDDQLAKLRQHCTLLQVELGRYADDSYESPARGKLVQVKEDEPASEETPILKSEKSTKKVKIVEDLPQEPAKNVEATSSPRSRPKPPKRMVNVQDLDQTDIAQQSLLIANLYYEMMQLLEELDMKDETLREMERSWKLTKKAHGEMKAQLKLAYDEIAKLKEEQLLIEERVINETKENESLELQRLVESINVGGNELERKMGEATRKLIMERVERIRYSRQCAILKTKVERLEWASRRIRDTAKEKETQSARNEIKYKFEIDLLTIEVGKLQNRILRSVPVEEYDKITRKYKSLLKESIGIETNNEEPPRSELNVMHQKSSDAEQEAKENMLKKMIDVVSDQCDFWSREAAILQAENEELKKFVEDIENESDLKSVLGAVETRLLDTIRELRNNEREHLREKKKQRAVRSENSRDSEKLRRERMALMNVINVLQRENSMLRTQSMGSVSLQQLEVLRQKIGEAREKEATVEHLKNDIEQLKEEAELELLKARAEKTASEVLNSNNEHPERVQHQLQIAYFNSSQQSAKVKNLEKTIHFKERKLAALEEELRDQKSWNLEILTAMEQLKDLRKSTSEVEKTSPEVRTKDERQEAVITAESDYEMDIRSEKSSGSALSDRIVVKTIVQDHTAVYENRVKEIKSAAQTALQGYKDQLAQKDLAIERYKQMLSEKIEEGVQIIEKVEVVEQEVIVPDRATLEKLKASEARIHELQEEEMTLMREIMANRDDKDGELMRQKAEVRALRKRVATLAKTNKELLATCEQIKEDAMAELSTFRKNNENIDEARINELRVEVERLKSVNRKLRVSNEELKLEIGKMKLTSTSAASKQNNDIEEWERKKRQEGLIKSLRERLKKKESNEKDLIEKLEKREKILETLRKDQAARQAEIEKMKKAFADNDPSALRKQISNSFKSRITELEAMLTKKDEERERLSRIATETRKTYDQYRAKMDKEIGFLKEELARKNVKIEKSSKLQNTVPVKTQNLAIQTESTPRVTEYYETTRIIEKETTSTDNHELKKALRLAEVRLAECTEKLAESEADLVRMTEKYERIKLRTASMSRNEKPTGAVLVLSDKLAAKDREIAQLRTYIAHLERSVNLPV